LLTIINKAVAILIDERNSDLVPFCNGDHAGQTVTIS